MRIGFRETTCNGMNCIPEFYDIEFLGQLTTKKCHLLYLYSKLNFFSRLYAWDDMLLIAYVRRTAWLWCCIIMRTFSRFEIWIHSCMKTCIQCNDMLFLLCKNSLHLFGGK